jgi:hypothetical protein
MANRNCPRPLRDRPFAIWAEVWQLGSGSEFRYGNMSVFLRLLFLGFAGVVAAAIIASSACAAPTRYALLIGVNSYPNLPPQRQLTRSVRDAKSLADALIPLGFKPIVLSNPGLEEMSTGINDFANRIAPGDTVLFFFSGHGVGPDGINLLLPSDLPSIDLKSLPR